MNTEKAIRQIVEAATHDFDNLENAFDKINLKLKHEKINQLNLEDLRTLLAYENWKDGAEPEMIKQIIDAKSTEYKSKIDLLKNLEIFGY